MEETYRGGKEGESPFASVQLEESGEEKMRTLHPTSQCFERGVSTCVRQDAFAPAASCFPSPPCRTPQRGKAFLAAPSTGSHTPAPHFRTKAQSQPLLVPQQWQGPP